MYNVSDYAKKLNSDDYVNYFEKLTLPNGTKLNDPYGIPQNLWQNNIAEWPTLAYPDIYSYFVLGSRLYSQTQMKTPKSLDGYQFFISGHVQQIKTYKCSDHIFLRAKVLPSQRQGKTTRMYDAFIVTNGSGEIMTAHCTCMAGMGKSCSHAAAIAFKVEAAVRTGIAKQACTSQACTWNDLSRTQEVMTSYRLADPEIPNGREEAVPCPVQHLDIRKRKFGESDDIHIVDKYQSQKVKFPVPSGNTITMLNSLKEIQPDAVIFTSTQAKALTENSYPKTIPEIIKEYKETTPKSIFDFLNITLDKDKISNLEQATVTQSESKLWHSHRVGRITSSRMHQVYSLKDDTPREKMVETIMCTSKPFSTVSTQYGITNEAPARQCYIRYQNMIHDNFHCSLSGLMLNKDFPHLGASPDGLIECDCCGKGCLEIKCFPTYKNGIPDPLGETTSTFPIDSNFQLKKSTKYQTQVQGHMLITGTSYCDFYMWSVKNSLAVRVFRDDTFITKLLLKLKQEYINHVLPALISIS